MRILDKYILKQLVLSFIFSLVAFVVIFIVVSLAETVDNFIDRGLGIAAVAEYYMVYIPQIIDFTTPIATLLSGLFLAGKMARLSELTAIRAAGVSFLRYSFTFIFFALIISAVAVGFSGYIIPMANKHLFYFEKTILNKDVEDGAESNIYFQDNETRNVSIAFFNIYKNNTASTVSIQEFSDTNFTKLTLRIDAESMVYKTETRQWILINGTKKVFADFAFQDISFDSLKISNLKFLPADVDKKQMKPDEMNLNQLSSLADEQKASGNNPTRVLIEFHTRFSSAFANLIVILFAIPFSANSRKGGVALQFGVCSAICFFYIVMMKISESFGKNGLLDPLITAWIPNCFFIMLAIIFLMKAEK